jgi:hypothetical protein
MKKLSILIYLCFIAVLSDAQVNNLVIKFSNGNERNLLISNVKSITFPTSTMLTLNVRNDGGNGVYSTSDIQKMYFETTATETPSIADNCNDLIVYPNPTQGLIYFKNLPDQTSTIRISTINGVQVFVGRIASSVQSIDLSFLAKGVYLMIIDNKTVKLIKL